MRTAGDEPYAYHFDPTESARALQQRYADLPDGEEAARDVVVRVAGRILASRFMGKLAFFSLLDDSGTIQVVIFSNRSK